MSTKTYVSDLLNSLPESATLAMARMSRELKEDGNIDFSSNDGFYSSHSTLYDLKIIKDKLNSNSKITVVEPYKNNKITLKEHLFIFRIIFSIFNLIQ